jgi:hypothetical protein
VEQRRGLADFAEGERKGSATVLYPMTLDSNLTTYEATVRRSRASWTRSRGEQPPNMPDRPIRAVPEGTRIPDVNSCGKSLDGGTSEPPH